MSKLVKIDDSQGEAYTFYCPGCSMTHIIPVKYTPDHSMKKGRAKPTWCFNGDMDKPTFSPNFRIEWKGAEPPQMCNVIIRDGVLIYLVDSTHKLSGSRVPMESYE
jgi:hypothetical protein